MSIKTKIVDFLLKNASFPTNIKSGNELDWMLKGNCPCCIAEPIEHLIVDICREIAEQMKEVGE